MKRHIFILGMIVLLATTAIIGCSAAAPVPQMPAPTAAPSQPLMGKAESGGAPSPAQPESFAFGMRTEPGVTANQALPGLERMIVYTGSISLQVHDTVETINQIAELLKKVNGYIANKSLVADSKGELRGTITIRVPAAALDTTLAQIKALGVRVLREDAQSNDVTEEYVDLEARRKNLEAYEAELQKLLETVRERTGKAEDILAVYNQLTEVRGQIEQIRGRQTYLENTSALATYTIELVPIEEVVVEGKPGWDPGRTAGRALDQLVTTLQGLADFVITFGIAVLPVLLILLVPLVVFILIIRAIAKRVAPKKTPTAA